MQDRRNFFKKTLALGVSVMAPRLFAVEENVESSFYGGDRTIWLLRNQKELKVCFYKDKKYDEQAYKEICYFLKDVRENVAVAMDPDLLNIVSFTQKWLTQCGTNKPIVIFSGYRTPNTNRLIENAAQNSFHLSGKALDASIDGVDRLYFAQIARRVGGGGIGLYQTHIHIDTGAVRQWRG